jgi:aminoglycoside 3-N-acetyltransferase
MNQNSHHDTSLPANLFEVASAPPALTRTKEPVSTDELFDDLTRLGLEQGDQIMVHASLSRVGWIQGGPGALIDILQRIVGGEGLLLMPTFNHGAPFSKRGNGFYDPLHTPSSSGLLSEEFWRLPQVFRSMSPTHPVAAWGAGAEELVSGHEATSTMGPGSPIAKLCERGGKLLHLGTDHRMSSAKHLAEMLEGAPCLAGRPDPFPVRLRGPGETFQHRIVLSWRYRQGPCPLTDESDLLERLMAGRQRTGLVGEAMSSLSLLSDFLDVTRKLLSRGHGHLGPCSECSIGPSERREGDWD